MADKNKQNIHFFESNSMRELYSCMENWQNQNQQRFLSIDIQKDNDRFCCIALTNPTEVVITNRNGTEYVGIYDGDKLKVGTY